MNDISLWLFFLLSLNLNIYIINGHITVKSEN